MSTARMFLASIALVIAIVGAARAETAASIDYAFVEPPANLPADFKVADGGAKLQFLAIKVIDGFRVYAALWQPIEKAVAATTLIVGVHGSGGNFAGPPIGSISPLLAAKGYGVLTISTRQHDNLINTDNFVEVRRDIEAAVYTARALGYRTFVLYDTASAISTSSTMPPMPGIRTSRPSCLAAPSRTCPGNRVTCWYRTRRTTAHFRKPQ